MEDGRNWWIEGYLEGIGYRCGGWIGEGCCLATLGSSSGRTGRKGQNGLMCCLTTLGSSRGRSGGYGERVLMSSGKSGDGIMVFGCFSYVKKVNLLHEFTLILLIN